ncbi:SDR family oxidoreductase [Paracoccus aerodenitrificans]|uniref:SDR family oxidoreductase n=1 Tax=Paracoccus aerodenitrificans TaxID=3017781 RepID=UPI0022EFFD0C|nr:SDR family oxidoreductase [Paracoccus aerodenitrificans]WBU63397.1 SDR family oxidoreductase [Paracoccus aerodenitrificans]
MSGVFIIGAAGKIGHRLGPILLERNMAVGAMARAAEQLEKLRETGVTPVEGDLLALDAAGLSTLMQGYETVIFSAGAGGKGGPEMTRAIDGEGLEKAVNAARSARVKRFILVSAFMDAGRGANPPNERFELYMQVKRNADARLVQSDLDWVILRPGTLTDEVGSGRIRAGAAIPYGNVSRDNVAATLAEIVASPAINHRIIELTDGGVPIAEAIANLAG